MGYWRDGEWVWEWRWRRRLFVWENSLVQELRAELAGVQPKIGVQDEWRWKPDIKRGYSVKSAYNILTYQQNYQKDQTQAHLG
ncbi:hypothetical protein SLA2020_239150 [Shorea laevis]